MYVCVVRVPPPPGGGGGGGVFPVGEERLLLSAINSVCMRITSCNSEVAKIHLIKHYSV